MALNMARDSTSSSTTLPPDDDYRHAYMAAIITTTIIAVLITWVRVYTRVFISRNAWWDDWVMFIATFLTIGTNAVLCEAYNLGLGRHIAYVQPTGQVKRCFMFLWIAEPTNLFALYAVRLSITLFFLRLIPLHKTFHRRLIWAIVGSLTVSDVYVTINYFIQCRPIQKVWDTEIEGTCLGDAAYQAAPWLYQAVSILADLALMSVPVTLFRSLKLPTRTKVGVVLLCCLGVFTCACAVVKTALLPALFDKTEEDKTWSLAQLCLWAPLEINIGMMCGSLPCIKPLYSRLRRNGTSLKVPSGKTEESYQLPSSAGWKSAKSAAAAAGAAAGADNAIYYSHDIEFSSAPVAPRRADSQDSILPRNMNYGGHVETRVHSTV